MKMIAADCLILGGGLSGWMAARECALAGHRPLIVHDGLGASPWVHGFNVPVAPGDSTASFLADTLKSGQGLSLPSLAGALCGDALDIFEMLQSMGLAFNREGDGYQLLKPLGSSHPRVASIGNETGTVILNTLRAQLREAVDELSECRALRLLMKDGRAIGALCFNKKQQSWMRVSARAVVLASGGYCGIFPVSTNKWDSGGDGTAMAYEAGARMCDMEFIQYEPSAALWPASLVGTSMITTLLFEGAVMRNRSGERFMLRYGPEGKRVGKDLLSRRIAAEVAAGRGTAHGGVYFDATAVGRERLESGYALYMERYRRAGIDLASEWIELGPAPHTSLGGVMIDENGATGVQGLYACGEVTGGLHGANRIGGNAGLETLVFGRRAGKSAARFAQENNQPSVEAEPLRFAAQSCRPFLQEARQAMKQALSSALGPVRTQRAMTEAEALLRERLAQAVGLCGRDAQEEFERLRLVNDLTTARMTILSALMRNDTLGCHCRGDFPDAAAQPYRVVIEKQGDGVMVCRKERIQQ